MGHILGKASFMYLLFGKEVVVVPRTICSKPVKWNKTIHIYMKLLTNSYFLYFNMFIFRQRKGERERDTHICVREKH